MCKNKTISNTIKNEDWKTLDYLIDIKTSFTDSEIIIILLMADIVYVKKILDKIYINKNDLFTFFIKNAQNILATFYCDTIELDYSYCANSKYHNIIPNLLYIEKYTTIDTTFYKKKLNRIISLYQQFIESNKKLN